MAQVIDLKGTSNPSLQIEKAGVKLKNTTGNVVVRNPADTADAQLTASLLNASGDAIVINSDATSTGNDFKTTIQRSSTQTQNVTYTLPVDDGSPTQYLQTDGNGLLSWSTVGGSSDKAAIDSTIISSGSAATVTMFTLPANAVVKEVQVIIDTAFNGTPSMSIGISGTTSKYMASNQVDLNDTAESRWVTTPNKVPSGSSEALVATYAAGGATVGSARILVEYAVPS